jgi:hypothetical protein
MKRGILVQGWMSSRFVIIGGVPGKDPAQLLFPEHDHVVRRINARKSVEICGRPPMARDLQRQ